MPDKFLPLKIRAGHLLRLPKGKVLIDAITLFPAELVDKNYQ
jgi:hypothetical protein